MDDTPIRVLLVDDDEGTFVLIRQLLQHSKRSFEVRWVPVSAARSTLLSDYNDVCLLDDALENPPGETGFDLLAYVRASGGTTPIIMLTESGSEEDKDLMAMQAGAADYLLKGRLNVRLLDRAIRYAIERNRIHGALRNSEERVRRVLHTAPVVLFELDADGIITFIDGAALRVLRLRAEDLVGRSAFEIYPVMAAETRRVLAGRPITVVVDLNGVTLQAHISPTVDASGALSGAAGVATDITRRVRNERALLASRRELKVERDFITTVLDTMGSLAVVLDPDGRVVRFNRACETLTGYSQHEVQGRTIWDLFIPPDELPIVRRAFSLIVQGRFPRAGENYWMTRSGGLRLISWSNNAILNAERQVEYIVATGIDITARKEAENALRASEERHRRIVETAHEGIVMIDTSGRTTFANARMAEMLGCSTEELQGREFAEFTDDEGRRIAMLLWGADAGRRTRRHDLKLLRKDGSVLWAIIATSPLFEHNGMPAGTLAMLTDITARKLAEEALQEANERLEMRVAERTAEIVEMMARLEQAHQLQQRFVADASHDLRTPLTVVRAEAEFLLARDQYDADTRESLERIVAESRRLEKMAIDLLLLATIDAQRSVVMTDAVQLDDLLFDCVTQLRTLASEQQISWNIDIDQPVMLRCNASMIQRALTNVLENAIKYSPNSGIVDVRFVLEPDSAIIEVADRGMGIQEKDLPHVFDRFYRGDLTRKTSGSGLGLAIVKAVVDSHGGHVDIVSGVGTGTTVRLQLPLEGVAILS